ncbi:hypothetical protein AAC387_Pa11g0360 [Persea americana]
MGFEVDTEFIQALEHRPKPSITEAVGIPLIDLSPLNSDDPEAISGLVAEIGAACREWGFFQVINHGVPPNSKRELNPPPKKFFALSPEEKCKVGAMR